MTLRTLLRSLLILPTVTPDRRRHVYPPTVGYVAGAAWLDAQYPDAWGWYTSGLIELQVAAWLARREDVRAEGVL